MRENQSTQEGSASGSGSLDHQEQNLPVGIVSPTQEARQLSQDLVRIMKELSEYLSHRYCIDCVTAEPEKDEVPYFLRNEKFDEIVQNAREVIKFLNSIDFFLKYHYLKLSDHNYQPVQLYVDKFSNLVRVVAEGVRIFESGMLRENNSCVSTLYKGLNNYSIRLSRFIHDNDEKWPSVFHERKDGFILVFQQWFEAGISSCYSHGTVSELIDRSVDPGELKQLGISPEFESNIAHEIFNDIEYYLRNFFIALENLNQGSYFPTLINKMYGHTFQSQLSSVIQDELDSLFFTYYNVYNALLPYKNLWASEFLDVLESKNDLLIQAVKRLLWFCESPSERILTCFERPSQINGEISEDCYRPFSCVIAHENQKLNFDIIDFSRAQATDSTVYIVFNVSPEMLYGEQANVRDRLSRENVLNFSENSIRVIKNLIHREFVQRGGVSVQFVDHISESYKEKNVCFIFQRKSFLGDQCEKDDIKPALTLSNAQYKVVIINRPDFSSSLGNDEAYFLLHEMMHVMGARDLPKNSLLDCTESVMATTEQCSIVQNAERKLAEWQKKDCRYYPQRVKPFYPASLGPADLFFLKNRKEASLKRSAKDFPKSSSTDDILHEELCSIPHFFQKAGSSIEPSSSISLYETHSPALFSRSETTKLSETASTPAWIMGAIGLFGVVAMIVFLIYFYKKHMVNRENMRPRLN